MLASVFERMLAILEELPPIGKDDYNQQQKFHFRGHDAVMKALNPLLAKHGVFVVPDVLDRTTAQRATRSGGVMYEVNLHVRYRFYGPNGDYVEASSWGEGTDSGDKATSKAMTMAFKSVLAQAFAIATSEMGDPDGETPEETVRRGAALDPMTVLPEVFRGEGEPLSRVGEAAAHVDPSVDWKATWQNAIGARWEGKTYGTLGPEEQREAIARFAHAVEKLSGEGDFPPPTDEQVAEAFVFAWEGLAVEVVRHELAAEPTADAPLGAGEAPVVDETIGFGEKS